MCELIRKMLGGQISEGGPNLYLGNLAREGQNYGGPNLLGHRSGIDQSATTLVESRI